MNDNRWGRGDRHLTHFPQYAATFCVISVNGNDSVMPRQSRRLSGTGIYHVMLRGINRQDIFEDYEDYRQFIKILSGLYSRPSEDLTTTICACHIFAYCLMPNHVHLLLREKEWHIGDIMKSIASSYVFCFNKKYGRIGHLFQDRFKSEPCDDMSYFFTLFRYIHQNPVKAGLVENAKDYEYSSWGNDYLGYSSMRVCTTHPVLKRVEFSRLQELVDMPLSGVVGCLDVDDERIVVSDEEVRNKLLQKSGSDCVTAFQSLNKELQKKIIAEVMECLRIGPRQMSRVSGLSYSVIQRLPGSWGQEH